MPSGTQRHARAPVPEIRRTNYSGMNRPESRSVTTATKTIDFFVDSRGIFDAPRHGRLQKSFLNDKNLFLDLPTFCCAWSVHGHRVIDFRWLFRPPYCQLFAAASEFRRDNDAIAAFFLFLRGLLNCPLPGSMILTAAQRNLHCPPGRHPALSWRQESCASR